MRPQVPHARDESEPPTSVLIGGGSPRCRGALVAALEREPGFTVVGHGADPAGVARLAAEHRPHVVVVAGDTDPMPAIRALAAGGPAPRVLVVSPSRAGMCHLDPPRAPRIAGVTGLTVNLTDMATLVPAVRLLRSGYRVCPAPPAPGAGPPADGPPADGPSGAVRPTHAWRHFDKLTGREVEVVHLMLRGWTNAEIAQALTLSGATVKSHVHSLMSKLELRSRIDVITTAYTTGFVRPR